MEVVIAQFKMLSGQLSRGTKETNKNLGPNNLSLGLGFISRPSQYESLNREFRRGSSCLKEIFIPYSTKQRHEHRSAMAWKNAMWLCILFVLLEEYALYTCHLAMYAEACKCPMVSSRPTIVSIRRL
jgi:hypothetical protein